MRVRYVNLRGNRYIRAEDVARYVAEIAATEETDTKRRLLDAADRLVRGQ